MSNDNARNLEPLFNMSWNGAPRANFEFDTRYDGFYDFYECRRCSAVVRDPHKHFDWHRAVDTAATVET